MMNWYVKKITELTECLRLSIIIIIIIIILVVTFMQSIYNYTPKQPTSLRYTVLQLFCIYSLCYM